MFCKLTALQSRLVASAVGLILIIALYLSISFRAFAYAADVDSIPNAYEFSDNDNDFRPYILEEDLEIGDSEGADEEAWTYAMEEVSALGKKEEVFYNGITNNVPMLDNAPQGTTRYYRFSNESIWGNKTSAGGGLPSRGLSRTRSAPDEEAAWLVYGGDLSGQDDGESGLSKRASATRTVYITLNTCLQPNDPTDRKSVV